MSGGGIAVARRSKQSSGEELAINFIVMLLMLPIIGLFMVGSKDPAKKTIGGVLLVVGLIIWLVMGCGS
jgi:hypothetical protein